MVGARLDDDFIRHLRSASIAASNLHREGEGSCGRGRASEIQRGRSAGRFRSDTAGQGSGCNRPLVGSAAAARFDYCRIYRTNGSIGQGRGRNSKGTGRCGLDDNFIRHLRSVSAASCDLHGEGVGSCGRRRSSEVQRSRSGRRSRGDTGGQRSRRNRPFVGSAAVAGVDDCRICFTDGAIGQGSGRDGNGAEAARAEKEQQGEYARLHNPMLPSLCRFPSVTEVRRLLLRSS